MLLKLLKFEPANAVKPVSNENRLSDQPIFFYILMMERVKMQTKKGSNNRQPVSPIEIGEILSNLGQVYRRQKDSQTQFHEYKQRFQADGLNGLKNLQPAPKYSPRATPVEVVNRVLEMCLQYPDRGCIRLTSMLQTEGISISSPTVQKILIKYNLGNKQERVLRLEEKAQCEGLELSQEQIASIEKVNPCFRERFNETNRPGELLVQDTFYVAHFKDVGKIYLQAVVDTYNSYIFGALFTGKLPDYAVAVLHNEVLPFYKENQLSVNSILTDNGLEFCGKRGHHYEIYLILNDIEHLKLPIHHSQHNGFIVRFLRIVQEEFFWEYFHNKRFNGLESLQHYFNQWLIYFNSKREYRGYRNLGFPPKEILHKYLMARASNKRVGIE